MLGNTVIFRPPNDCPGYPEQAGHSVPDFVLIYSTSFCFISDFSHILPSPIHLQYLTVTSFHFLVPPTHPAHHTAPLLLLA
jgi:hypothetical protein